MILPVGAETFAEAMQMGTETYHTLRGIIQAKYGEWADGMDGPAPRAAVRPSPDLTRLAPRPAGLDAVNVGDEGGFAPPIDTFEAALDLLTTAIKDAGYAGKASGGGMLGGSAQRAAASPRAPSAGPRRRHGCVRA